MQMNIIYQCDSFATFLNLWFKKVKEQRSNFSMGRIAYDLQLSGTAEISKVFNRKRPVSHYLLRKFKTYWNLESKESYYLDLLAERDRNLDNPVLARLIANEIKKIQRSTS